MILKETLRLSQKTVKSELQFLFFIFVLLLTLVQIYPGTSSIYATNSGPYLRGDWLEMLTDRRRARTGTWWATEYYQVCFNSTCVILNLPIIRSVHSGVTTGDVKMNFGRAKHLRYKKYIVPIYGSFLQKCYSKFFFSYFTIPILILSQ